MLSSGVLACHIIFSSLITSLIPEFWFHYSARSMIWKRILGIITGTATETVVLDIPLHLTVLHTAEQVVIAALHLEEADRTGTKPNHTATHVHNGRRWVQLVNMGGG